jgi:cobalt-zinc-cadmium efflux system outer membrane protein
MIDGRADVMRGVVRADAQWTNPLVDFRRENIGSPLLPDEFMTAYLPLDLTGRRLAFRRAASAGVARAAAEREAQQRALVMTVAQSWVRAALGSAALAIAADRRAALDSLARYDSTRAAEGAVAEVVALRARLEADRALVLEGQATAEAAGARAALARLLGRATDALGELAPLPAPDALPALPSTEVLVAEALARRADLRALRDGVRVAEARASAESRGVLPEWQVQAGSKRTSGFLTGQVGVLVPLPLFHRNDAARQRVRGELAIAQAELADGEARVSAEVDAAVRSYAALVNAQPARASEFATRGAQIATIIRTAYREGGASLVELLDAERAAADARLAGLRWAADIQLARLEVAFARGTTVPELP